jgi:hypothetical protein
MSKQGCPTADKILAYLLKHPQAQDTMEGIVEWWLLEQKIQYAAEDMESALHDLVNKRFVISHQGTDGRIRYRLNRELEPLIRRRLNQKEAAPNRIKKSEKRKNAA